MELQTFSSFTLTKRQVKLHKLFRTEGKETTLHGFRRSAWHCSGGATQGEMLFKPREDDAATRQYFFILTFSFTVERPAKISCSGAITDISVPAISAHAIIFARIAKARFCCLP
ncbi:hypothetical protein LEMLEM_LOCUS12130 [Lemmus lemmus]